MLCSKSSIYISFLILSPIFKCKIISGCHLYKFLPSDASLCIGTLVLGEVEGSKLRSSLVGFDFFISQTKTLIFPDI